MDTYYKSSFRSSWVVKKRLRLKLSASTIFIITSGVSFLTYELVTPSSLVNGDIEYAPGRSTAIICSLPAYAFFIVFSFLSTVTPAQFPTFSFLPVRLEGQGILLSVLHLGKCRNWHEGSTLTRVKVRPRWGQEAEVWAHNVMPKPLPTCSVSSTKRGWPDLPLRAAAESQGDHALESTSNWKSAVHLFNQHYSSTYHVSRY